MSDPLDGFDVIEGCRVRIMRKGSGAPLPFLHGASGAARWLPSMDALAREYDVIVPKHPGYGASDDPDWIDPVGDLAYFYLVAIGHTGLDPVHLVGNSPGGWIAAEMAVRDPSAMRGLVLVAPAGVLVPGAARRLRCSPQLRRRRPAYGSSRRE